MRRVLFLATGFILGAGILAASACSSTPAFDRSPSEDASLHKEGGPVVASEAGAYDGGSPLGPDPSCASYCGLVMDGCNDARAQYASRDECMELCARLPLGDAGDKGSNSVACRQYYAGGPAQADPLGYCLVAGPFGGGVCGDRCPVFCELAVGACSPGSGAKAPFVGYPECQEACTSFSYKDAGTDGGGERPDGPASGDTLNCRLFRLRAAIHDVAACSDLGADSGACR